MALRTENAAIFEDTEFSQSAPCVSAGKLRSQRTNQAYNFENKFCEDAKGLCTGKERFSCQRNCQIE